MKDQEAMRLVAKMYAAHGTLKPAEVVAELAGEALDSACPSCAKKVLEMGRLGSKPLTVQTYRDTYRTVNGSPEHGFHVGQNDAQVDVGKIEARWRRDAVKALTEVGYADLDAQFTAARIWASGAVDIALMPEEATVQLWRATLPSRVTRETVEAAWTYARFCASNDLMKITHAEWNAAVRPFDAAVQRAMLEAVSS